jgi:glutaminase
MDLPSIAEQAERPNVSTGHLPEAETVQTPVSDAHRRFKSNTDGHNSQIYLAQVYPALARVPCDLFGVCVVGTSGSVYAAGDTEHECSIMIVSKPFVFALVCETIGPEEARDKLGANATGPAFNSLAGPRRQRLDHHLCARPAAADFRLRSNPVGLQPLERCRLDHAAVRRFRSSGA